MSSLNKFIQYLKNQIGQPYLWGGQHTRLTVDNYISIIKKRENGRGGYSDGQSYADAVMEFCKKKFDKGAEVLYAYDCSGLGCYWLFNLQHLYKCDVNANTMMSRCELKDELPKKGWWVFRLEGKKAVHIGYMVDDEHLIEAKGRRYGVVEIKFKKNDWDKWGIPNVFKDDIVNGESDLDPVDPDLHDPKDSYVVVVGNSVRVHKLPKVKSKTLLIAHSEKWYKEHHHTDRVDSFKVIDIADNGWYHIQLVGDKTHTGYITNKTKYVRPLKKVNF